MISLEKKPILVTGGAGFIGANVADRLAALGERVIVYDNLSRAGVQQNARWLATRHGDRVEIEVADVRDADRLRKAVARVAHVFHFAAQVAVTTSVADPLTDFEVNARGTLNVLTAIRSVAQPPSLLYASTNKVYGDLDGMKLEAIGGRYVPVEQVFATSGVDERWPLDFYSPYGCSKGCADQYVLDHARSFGLRTTVFRMSCIYGPRQLGTEDQGWVAHFVRRALAGHPITIYGDGRQVRDVLYIEDLVSAMMLAREGLTARTDVFAGRAFNIGGGPQNAVSLFEVIERISARLGARPELRFGTWRPGDQRYYVSDTSAFRRATGWAPSVSAAEGLGRLAQALAEREPSGPVGAAPFVAGEARVASGSRTP